MGLVKLVLFYSPLPPSERPPLAQPRVIVQPQKICSSLPFRDEPGDSNILGPKVLRSSLRARLVKGHDLPSLWVERDEVRRAFGRAAGSAPFYSCQRQPSPKENASRITLANSSSTIAANAMSPSMWRRKPQVESKLWCAA